jgi:hypothetical protein
MPETDRGTTGPQDRGTQCKALLGGGVRLLAKVSSAPREGTRPTGGSGGGVFDRNTVTTRMDIGLR